VRLIIVLTSILAFGVVAYDLVTDRQRTEQAALDAARQQALVQSRAAAEMVQASLDRFDFALQTAREAAIAGPGAMAFQEQVIARTLPSNLALQQFRIGADGYLEYSSLGPAPRNYLGDRDYFKELAADKADRLVVSPRAGPAHQKWSIQVARAIQRDGRFDGVVAIAVSPEEWAKQLASFEAGPRDTLTLWTPAGTCCCGPSTAPRTSANRPPEARIHPAPGTAGGALRGPRLGGWRPARVWLDAPAQPRAGDAVGDRPRRRPRPGARDEQPDAAARRGIRRPVHGADRRAAAGLARYERAGRRLAQQEAHSRHIVEHMADGIVVVDADERIVRVNPAFCAITGFSPGALEGSPSPAFAPTANRASWAGWSARPAAATGPGISMASAPTGATTSATR
jgi:PAS domain-containing protein